MLLWDSREKLVEDSSYKYIALKNNEKQRRIWKISGIVDV